MAGAIRNYYYPILTGKLVVEVDNTVINAASFEAVSASLGSEVVPAWMVAFVRELKGHRDMPAAERVNDFGTPVVISLVSKRV